MTSIREAAAQAVHAGRFPGQTGADVWDHRYADAAITAFRKAAAEQGWHMRPDEASDMMAAPEFEWNK